MSFGLIGTVVLSPVFGYVSRVRTRSAPPLWRVMAALAFTLGAAPFLLSAADEPPVPAPVPAPSPDAPPPPAPAPTPAPPIDPKEAKQAHDDDTKAFVARVNAAIDRGQKYLLDSQRPEGTWTPRKDATLEVDAYGVEALVLTALAKTGVKPSHPKMVLGLKVLRQMIVERRGQQRYAGIEVGHRTYAAACVTMLLDALYVEHPKRDPDRKGANGPPAPAKMKDSLPEDARDDIKDVVAFLVKSQRESLWRYPGPAKENEDLSATQYALMALLTAGRVGVHAPPEVYRRALIHLLAWQEKKTSPTEDLVPLFAENPVWDPTDRYPRYVPTTKFQARGWSYQGKGPVTGSMTCAGISCLAIIKDRLKAPHLKPPQSLSSGEEKQIDKAINGGIAWLSKQFTVESNPGGGGWHYYYLYGMERAASLIGLGNIGAHDWYREAADYLLGKQAADGSWPVEKDVHVQTAFALLVLKRATVPTSFGPPPTTGGVDDVPTDLGGTPAPDGAAMDGAPMDDVPGGVGEK
jgi:hypothetical protein